MMKRLYLVTDRGAVSHRPEGINLLQATEEALRAGLGVVQFREKNALSPYLWQEAMDLRRLTLNYKALFIVNNYPELAQRVGADGVHIGPGDVSYEEAREIIGPQGLVGVSCYSLEEALAAQEKGADYLGVGIWNSEKTKPEVLAAGIGEVEKICSKVRIPVVGIGGITDGGRLEQSLRAGVDYIAMVSGILSAPDIFEAVRTYNYIISQFTSSRPFKTLVLRR